MDFSNLPPLDFLSRWERGFPPRKWTEKYTKQALAMSRARARYVRIRIRDGKERRDYGQYKAGAVSLVTTLPPWAVATVGRIGPSEREDLMLRLAEAQARLIHGVSGRPMFGGGVHLDTAVPHWHSHIPKTDEQGNVYPKANFFTAGPWLTGTCRIERKFPGLLTQWKRDRMEANLKKTRRADLVDLAATEAIDAELENWIRERGLWHHYERDCAEYVAKKTKAQQEEPVKRITQAALGYHHRTGVWPLAWQTMSLTMWRLIPPEIRPVIMLSIRAVQVVRRPKRAASLGKSMVELLREPQITPPFPIPR